MSTLPPPQNPNTVFGAPPAYGVPPQGIPNITAPVLPPVPKQPPCTTPNKTIYINNLNEKIKIPALKNALQAIFEQYGEILEIVARHTLRMRGQAFVVFKEQDSAVIQYAKTKSDAIAKLDGTIEENKRQRMEAREKRAREPPAKKFKSNNTQIYPMGASNTSGAQLFHFGHQVPATGNIPDEYLPPNNILFLQNLPNDITASTLIALFEQYPGFKEVRSIHPAKGIAFVEYDNEPQAMIAKEALSNHPITPDHKLKITYAKK
ncbi:3651_t:CDS:2 [Diversispora eburnea]|uniref:3651_t:CDS:1 n=1 Tax=Diversispora eburnea TaxID=1213867 RepID=A0A9N8ZGS5_9GLOM|nr:3651_t:CDS:2 [Diversispora eburnea]